MLRVDWQVSKGLNVKMEKVHSPQGLQRGIPDPTFKVRASYMGKERWWVLQKRQEHKEGEITLKELINYPSELLHFHLKCKYLDPKYKSYISPTFHALSYKKFYKHKTYLK